MSDVQITPCIPRGAITAPPSKSAAHRALICAALARGSSTVCPVAQSDDMTATIQVLHAMGVHITRSGQQIRTESASFNRQPVTLDCIESGSTLRFLLPVAAALGIPATFVGKGRLPDRPIGPLREQLQKHGIVFEGEKMPFLIRGKLRGGQFSLPGNVSSQYVSGLLFALPLAEEDSEILLTSPLESTGYVKMTLDALQQAGVLITWEGSRFFIPGRQNYQSHRWTVEGGLFQRRFLALRRRCRRRHPRQRAAG